MSENCIDNTQKTCLEVSKKWANQLLPPILNASMVREAFSSLDPQVNILMDSFDSCH